MHRHIRSLDDVLALLDGLFVPDADRWTERAGDWRDRFYADREREVPFFVAKPDENLASYRERGLDVRDRVRWREVRTPADAPEAFALRVRRRRGGRRWRMRSRG